MHGPVVAGVDGSAESGFAVAWAAREADLRGRALMIVHVVDDTAAPGTTAADAVLDDAVARARAAAPGIPVRAERAEGHPKQALIQESRRASLIVVGRRGTGGFAGLMLGSVAIAVCDNAECPVASVPVPGRPAAAGVLVGVDGSPDAEAAIEFAFEEASLREVDLDAVHAWASPTSTGPGDITPVVYELDDLADEEARLLSEVLAGWREKYPEVLVNAENVRGHAAGVLVERSNRAEVVVMGRRGTGRLVKALLGSVTHSVLHHAGVPVVVVPSRG
jgi:nucleotide-binding universal stress UspA family protein